MKKGSPWYKRDPIAFMDGVEGMGPELIGAYAYLIDLIYARDGLSPRDDAALAGRMGCSKRKVTALIEELIRRKKIIIRDGFMTCKHAEDHANKRRARSEQGASAGRASGEKRRAGKQNNNLDERSVQSSDEQSTEYRVQSTDIPPNPPKGGSAKSRATRLPQDWVIPQEFQAWALSQGLSEFDVRKQADVFKDYWIAKAGKDGTKTDWFATWRNWIRRAVERRPVNGTAPGKSYQPGPALREVQERKRREEAAQQQQREDLFR